MASSPPSAGIPTGGLGMTATAADRAIRDLYTRLLEAWNERNAERYAALFAADGAMIGFDGTQASGGQIADHLRPIFAHEVCS
jgi:uncharacterized protein (TIGR02246 family)